MKPAFAGAPQPNTNQHTKTRQVFRSKTFSTHPIGIDRAAPNAHPPAPFGPDTKQTQLFPLFVASRCHTRSKRDETGVEQKIEHTSNLLHQRATMTTTPSTMNSDSSPATRTKLLSGFLGSLTLPSIPSVTAQILHTGSPSERPASPDKPSQNCSSIVRSSEQQSYHGQFYFRGQRRDGIHRAGRTNCLVCRDEC